MYEVFEAELLKKLRPDSRFLMLHHIAVDPDYHENGYGSRLMGALFEEGKKRRIARVELDVWTFNENAKRFFAKFGFNVFNQRMDAAIDQGSNKRRRQ